jgi:hypothetical protein
MDKRLKIGSRWVNTSNKKHEIVCLANKKSVLPLTVIFEDSDHEQVFALQSEDFLYSMKLDIDNG